MNEKPDSSVVEWGLCLSGENHIPLSVEQPLNCTVRWRCRTKWENMSGETRSDVWVPCELSSSLPAAELHTESETERQTQSCTDTQRLQTALTVLFNRILTLSVRPIFSLKTETCMYKTTSELMPYFHMILEQTSMFSIAENNIDIVLEFSS